MTDHPNQPDIKQKIEFQLRQTTLLQMRGDLIGAQKACIEILKVEPTNVEALELMGDLMYARGDVDHAVMAYRQAKDNSAQGSPSYASAERKWATLLYQQSLPEASQSDAYVNPWIAAVLSILLPGIGHLWLKQYTKAGILMACGLVFTTLLLFSPWGINETIARSAITTGPIVISCMLLTVVLTATIDAFQSAAACRKSVKPVHPTLPEEVRNNPNAKP